MPIPQYKFHVEFEFTEPLLGAAPLNKALYSEFVASKAPQDQQGADEEVLTIEDAVDKGTTGFHKDGDGSLFLLNHVIKGMLKEGFRALSKVKGTEASKVTAHQKAVNKLIFVEQRHIPVQFEGQVEMLERPLRASTPQGERVALARSEMLPAGSRIAFTLILLDPKLEGAVRECFEYGELSGMGQWRNGGYGTFKFTMVPLP